MRQKTIENDKLFRKLIDNSYSGIYLLNESFEIIYRRLLTEELGVVEASSKQKHSIKTLTHPDDLEKVIALLSEIIKSPGNSSACVFRSKNHTGDFIWLRCTFSNMLNDPEVNAIVCNFLDINKDKLEHENITKSENFIRTITDNLPALIAYWNADLVCMFANKPHLEWFEMAAGKMIGINKLELLGQKEFDLHRAHIEEVLNGIPQRFERTFYKPTGDKLFTLTQYLPDEHAGVIKGFYSLIYDVTEVKKLEILLNKATKLARMGSWEFILKDNSMFWSDSTKEIHEVEPDFQPTMEAGIHFYKEGKDRKVIKEKIRLLIENGEPFDEELQILTFSGKYKWIRVIGESEFVNFKCARAYGSFQDINNQKISEIETLKAYEEKNIILESIGDAFFAVDRNWIISYWNKTSENVFFKNRDEVLGRNLWEILSDDVGSKSYNEYHRALETNRASHFEHYYILFNKWYEISAYPSTSGLSVYLKDVTIRKLSDLKLKSLNDSLQIKSRALAMSNAELEQFAFVASHDLQEPLRMVASFMTLLDQKYGNLLDAKGKQYIQFAVDGAKRMRNIILDLLDFSRIGRTSENNEDVDVTHIIEDILVLFRKQIDEQNAQIIFKCLPIIKSAKAQVRQVFQNLIGNALKYQQNFTQTKIEVSAEDIGVYWKFAIKDNGIGIDPEHFEKIFIIFQRLRNHTEYTGTGMGLAITKKIVESLGGDIWVHSNEGEGSTFYFTISK